MSELFKNIVRLPPPHTARSYSQLTPVYTADEVAKTVASFEAELAKANEEITGLKLRIDNQRESLKKQYSRNDIAESELANANERVALLERVEKIFNESPELTFENAKSMFSEELNKFAIEKKTEVIAHILRSYKTKKFYPTNYAIQAFNDGVAHLWAHIECCELQLRKEQEHD